MSRKLIIVIDSQKPHEYTCESKKLHDEYFTPIGTFFKNPERSHTELLEWAITTIREIIKKEKLPHLSLIIKDKWLNSVLAGKKSFYTPKNLLKSTIEEYQKTFQSLLEENLVSWKII